MFKGAAFSPKKSKSAMMKHFVAYKILFIYYFFFSSKEHFLTLSKSKCLILIRVMHSYRNPLLADVIELCTRQTGKCGSHMPPSAALEKRYVPSFCPTVTCVSLHIKRLLGLLVAADLPGKIHCSR